MYQILQLILYYYLINELQQGTVLRKRKNQLSKLVSALFYLYKQTENSYHYRTEYIR